MNQPKTTGQNVLSPQFHVETLKKIVLSQIRIPVWVFCLFLVNIGVSGWHLIVRSIQKDTLSFFQAFVQEFDLSIDFFSEAFHEAFNYIPMNWLSIFFVNCLLLLVLWRFSSKIKHLFDSKLQV